MIAVSKRSGKLIPILYQGRTSFLQDDGHKIDYTNLKGSKMQQKPLLHQRRIANSATPHPNFETILDIGYLATVVFVDSYRTGPPGYIGWNRVRPK
jgi:hypothetical protein